MTVMSRATAEFIRTGQERAYGDTVTEAIITIEMSSPFVDGGDFRQVAVGEAQAKRLASGLVGWSDDPGDPFSTRLDSFTVLGEGRYRVVTRARYCD